MEIILSICLFLLINLVKPTACWQYFTPLSSIKLTNSAPDMDVIHSEYYYGDCKRTDIIFYTHVHLDHMDVLGKIIVRGWIDVIRIPTCILLRARAFEYDIFRNTAYNFQICVPRITYCHSQHRYKYFYYEWYIPLDMIGGMNWDLYFYGPSSAIWQ